MSVVHLKILVSQEIFQSPGLNKRFLLLIFPSHSSSIGKLPNLLLKNLSL